MPVDPHAGVVTVTTAEHLRARTVDYAAAEVALRNGFVPPIELAGEQGRPLDGVLDRLVTIGAARFQEQHASIRSGRQARGDIPGRVYTPEGEGPFPVFVNFHGGGWVIGDPDASPLHADSLARLPPALVITAEFDPLRDEGEAFAAALRNAGVDAQAVRHDGLLHDFFATAQVFPASRAGFDHACQALCRALA
jgi:acetyl esterase/lipase